jgi:GntR family transcriptional repressor for pyruvate dehydrogenase complex
MALAATEPRRLYRLIADRLRCRMRAGEFLVGTRLPPERDLAQQLGVSRPSVREALIALEVEGLVEVRMGSGIYVVALESAASRPSLGDASGPFEIIRARQVLEGELAALAACSMSAAQLDGLRASVAAMEADVSEGRVPLRGDRLFHVGIAQACDNAPLLRTVMQWFDERHNPLFEQLGQHFENEANWRAAMAEHREVIEAIAAREPQRARQAMHLHFQRTHDRFAAAWPQAAPAAQPPLTVPAASAAAQPMTNPAARRPSAVAVPADGRPVAR